MLCYYFWIAMINLFVCSIVKRAAGTLHLITGFSAMADLISDRL